MSFTVEPGLYVAPDKAEIELTLLAYDLEERNERRIRLGPTAASAKDAEEKENAKTITHKVPREFLGIGVRIEDDIYVTADGHENMTSSVPTEITDVEAMCAEEPLLPSGS
jgi:Xaa-Pro aminopeptidase